MPGQSVEAFLRCLHELAESCDFGEKEEENIRDRIIAGMSDKELSLKLQLEQLSTLTLSKTVEIARMRELVKTQVASEVSHVTSQKHFSRGKPFKSRQPSRGLTSKDPRNKCPRCGYVHRSSARDACPALNAECWKCGKTEHFQSSPWCKGTVADKQSSQQSSQQSYNQSRRRANVHEVNVDVDDLSDMTHGMFLGSVTADEQEIYETDSAEISYEDPYVKNCPNTVPAWCVKLNIAGASVDFKINPGADTAIMSWDTYQLFNHKPYLSPTAAVLSSPCGALHPRVQFTAMTLWQGQKYRVRLTLSWVEVLLRTWDLWNGSTKWTNV